MTTTSETLPAATIVEAYAEALCAALGVDPAAASTAYGDDRRDDAQLEVWRLHHATTIAGYRAQDVDDRSDLPAVFTDPEVVRADAAMIDDRLAVRVQATTWEKHPEHATLAGQDGPWQVGCAVAALRDVVDAF